MHYARWWRRHGEGKHTFGFRLPSKPVDESAHPLVKAFFKLVDKEGISFPTLARKAGVHHGAIKGWRRPANGIPPRLMTPKLECLEACLNVLGYRLCIKEIGGEVK